MLRTAQRRWNIHIQQQTFLRGHAQVENKIPKFREQTSRRKPPKFQLQHAAGQVKKKDANITSFRTQTLNLAGQATETCISEWISNQLEN